MFFCCDVRYGGFVTYTEHLVRGLRQQGRKVELFKVTRRGEKKQRPFSGTVTYRNVSLREAQAIAKLTRPTIVAGYWRTHDEPIAMLIAQGAAMVIHDPTEMHREMMPRLKGSRLIAIRRTTHDRLLSEGYDATLARHPFCWTQQPDRERTRAAVAFSRIDFDKNTDWILAANEHLDEPIEIYGAVNRLYAHHKLADQWPEWEQSWHGEFPKEPRAAEKIAEEARHVVDMSVIAGDGDGTQYTFLEAWAAGAQLVVHHQWVRTGSGPVNANTAAIAVDPEHLAEIVRADPDPKLIENGKAIVRYHAPEHMIPEFETARG